MRVVTMWDDQGWWDYGGYDEEMGCFNLTPRTLKAR